MNVMNFNYESQYLIQFIIVKYWNCDEAYLYVTVISGPLWNPEGDRIFTRQEHVSEWTGTHPGVGRLSDDPDWCCHWSVSSLSKVWQTEGECTTWKTELCYLPLSNINVFVIDKQSSIYIIMNEYLISKKKNSRQKDLFITKILLHCWFFFPLAMSMREIIKFIKHKKLLPFSNLMKKWQYNTLLAATFSESFGKRNKELFLF